MGEITLEKKKQIENYIVVSYFDGCKNVEAYCKGGDILKGSDEYDIPDLVVFIDVFGMSGVYIIHWDFLSDFGSELKNEFMIRIATDRSITRNRCDSVDALKYAWVSWNKQLEEKTIFLNDKRIKDLEKEIKELQTENQQLKKKLHELDPIPEFKDNHICGGQRSVNGWRGVSSFWRLNYKKLSELVGFSSVEEIQDYLTNEAECDTLHESILKLRDEVTYTCEKLASANSENNSWKATAECNTPKELSVKLTALRDEIDASKSAVDEAHDRTTEMEALYMKYWDQIKAWKEPTGFNTPDGAKDYWTTKLRESGEVNESFAREIRSWREATGCSTSEEAKKKLKGYKNRLDSAKQSASIAIRHLDNIVFRDDKRSD